MEARVDSDAANPAVTIALAGDTILGRGAEVYRGKPLIYDAGDFVDDYFVDPDLRNDRGLLFLLTADTTGARRLELLPTLIDDCRVNRATGAERDASAARITALSAEMGTTIRDDGERLVVELLSFR
jgi:hypothetical protein